MSARELSEPSREKWKRKPGDTRPLVKIPGDWLGRIYGRPVTVRPSGDGFRAYIPAFSPPTDGSDPVDAMFRCILRALAYQERIGQG